MQLVPTRHSRLMRVEIVKNFEREDVFVSTLRSVLERESAQYEKLLVIPCSDY